jgi:hypothetical protein
MTQSIYKACVRQVRAPVYTIAVLTSALALGACATTPQPPSGAFQAAESAISTAEQARVADYASAELTLAREKLAAARTAAQNEDMLEAEYLAQQSEVYAQLASARAEEAKAKAINDDMQKSIDTLKHEMQRVTGATQ